MCTWGGGASKSKTNAQKKKRKSPLSFQTELKKTKSQNKRINLIASIRCAHYCYRLSWTLVHERKFIKEEVEQVSVKLNKQVHQMERIEKIHFWLTKRSRTYKCLDFLKQEVNRKVHRMERTEENKTVDLKMKPNTKS